MRVAHLSDVHMLGSARASRELGVRFLSFGRRLDVEERRRKLFRSLAAARDGGADHVVVSGDLTEIGSPDQYEAFAEVLHDSGVHPDRVTLVPGNHDTYASPDAWRSAMDGPLAAFRRGAATEPGKVVERGGVVILPVDVACHQTVARSAGELDAASAEALGRRLRDPSIQRRPVLLVLHHSPFPHGSRAWQWIDGLRGWERLVPMLERSANTHVLHGHHHAHIERSVGGGPARVFGATATVDDGATARVRFYDLQGDVYASRPPVRLAA